MDLDNQYVTYHPIDDYVQSANTLFHFMKKLDYLKSILIHSALIPRYCIENIDFLHIHNDKQSFNEIAVLQKCFCDIPFHKLADTFPICGIGEGYNSLSAEERKELEKGNTHFAYYGEYAIAFSKRWGELKKLQPVHYLNEDSQYALDFASLFKSMLKKNKLPDLYAQDVMNRLAFIKPLRGIMKRDFKRSDSTDVTIEINKNFHDECEWRYVPDSNTLSSAGIDAIIANPNIIIARSGINNGLENEKYKDLWLSFSYDEIRYIIVPDSSARIEMIKVIQNLPDSRFSNADDIQMQRFILISKILVISEIRKDW